MKIKAHVPLAPHTTLHVGGVAEQFVSVTSRKELHAALAHASNEAMPVTILGGGSNVLISDDGVPGLVIKNEIHGITCKKQGTVVYCTVGAGESWDAFVAHAVTHGWWGIENLSAIPGSVGATPIQNVGAYGVEVATVIESVEVFDQVTGTIQRLTPAECAFAYRDSLFKHADGRNYIVTAVTFALHTTPTPQLQYADLQNYFGADASPTLGAVRDAVIEIRSRKFPDWHKTGTAGSFFKNPIITRKHYEALLAKHPKLPMYPVDEERVKVPLGWVLDNMLQLRGVHHGNVGTYKGQALVIVNCGSASAREIDQFATMIEERVYDATGITIAREVTCIPHET